MDVVLLTSRKEGLPLIFLTEVLKKKSISINAVIFSRNEKNRVKYLKQKLKKIRKQGLSTILSGIYLRSLFDEKKYLKTTHSIEQFCAIHAIPFIQIGRTVNLKEGDKKSILNLQFDVGISIGNSFVGKFILNLPKDCFINIHHEILPAYKGAQSIIWQLYNYSSVSGFTIHKMNNTIDGGVIIYVKEFQIIFYESFKKTIQANLEIIKKESIQEMVKILNEGSISPMNINTKVSHYTTPNLFQLFRIVLNYKKLRKGHS